MELISTPVSVCQVGIRCCTYVITDEVILQHVLYLLDFTLRSRQWCAANSAPQGLPSARSGRSRCRVGVCYAALWRAAAVASSRHWAHCIEQETLALASMARDDPPASSTASSTAAAMRGKVGSEFET